MKDKFKKITLLLFEKNKKRGIKKDAKIYLKRHKNQYKKYNLSKEDRNEILNVWSPYIKGKKEYNFHKLYSSYLNIFDKNYISDLIFKLYFLPVLNPEKIKAGLSDKMLTQYLFSRVEQKNFKLPEIIIYNCNGYFYDNNGIITKENALSKISNIGEVIIKPTIGSNSGKGIMILDLSAGIDSKTLYTAGEIINKYKSNFVIQKKIKQCKELSDLNISSVNTIRINTYICGGKVFCSPTAIRVGRAGKIVDNAHAGGLAVGVDGNGCLRKYGFTEDGQVFERHPDSKVMFEGYKIPKITEMEQLAIQYHHVIPQIGIIAWDFTVDKEENIVLIETNISAPSVWFPQYCNGKSFFGSNTEKMINEIKGKWKYEK